MTRLLFSRFRDFAGDRQGNVLIIFALALLPLLGMTAVAVNYSQGLAIKAKLDTAADAAAIAGIAAARDYLQNYTGSSDVTTQALAAAQTAASAQFTANTSQLSVPAPTMNFSVRTGSISGSVTYSFTYPTYLTKLLGRPNLTVANTAKSTLAVKTYANIYIVLDNSESMGIGATWADQCALFNMLGHYNLLTGQTAGSCTDSSFGSTSSGYGPQDSPDNNSGATIGRNGLSCILACHTASQTIPDPSHPGSTKSVTVNTEQLANCATNPTITLRLDVAKQAIIDALNILPTDGSVQVSVYRMSEAIDLVVGPTSNFPSIATAVVGTGAVCPAPAPGQTLTSLASLTTQTGIQLGTAYTTSGSSILPTNVSSGTQQGGTNITSSLKALKTALPAGGNGWSPGSPLRYLVLVTDSVEDNVLNAFTLPTLPASKSSYAGYYNTGSSVSWNLGEMDPSACTPFTNATTAGGLGYQVYTLYVDYIIPPTNSTGTTTQISSNGPNVPAAFMTPYHNDSFPAMFNYIGAHFIPPAVNPLQTCANTPSNAFSANTPVQIETAMQQIFQAIIPTQARLTY